nr:unnamed protein product [Digitaria exilis]
MPSSAAGFTNCKLGSQEDLAAGTDSNGALHYRYIYTTLRSQQASVPANAYVHLCVSLFSATEEVGIWLAVPSLSKEQRFQQDDSVDNYSHIQAIRVEYPSAREVIRGGARRAVTTTRVAVAGSGGGGGGGLAGHLRTPCRPPASSGLHGCVGNPDRSPRDPNRITTARSSCLRRASPRDEGNTKSGYQTTMQAQMVNVAGPSNPDR